MAYRLHMANDMVTLSFRLTRTDWLRLHEEVSRMRAENHPAASLQGVILTALNDFFAARDEPPMETIPYGRGGPRVSGKK